MKFKQKLKLWVTAGLIACGLSNYTGPVQAETVAGSDSPYQSIIIDWPVISGAVDYELQIKDGDKVIYAVPKISASGYQLSLAELEQHQANLNDKLTWQVRGLNIKHEPISEFSEPRELFSGKTFNRYWNILPNLDKEQATTPRDNYNYLITKDVAIWPLKLTGEFSEMDYLPVYPVFSWVHVPKAAKYHLQVYRYIDAQEQATEPIENLDVGDHYDYYGNHAYTVPGKYYYVISAYDAANNKLAQSPKTYFTVTSGPVEVAALGDSITHGGGTVNTPPGANIYNWEAYTKIPVLNIGYSGNTTKSMLNRFQHDVVPFKPRYLVIMGGVNDIRTGISATDVINNLQQIGTLARQHQMIPIFLTVTPVNPELMSSVINLPPVAVWDINREIINSWIRQQPDYIDVAPLVTDERGELNPRLTTDGLHPDAEGKRLIGEAVGDYLREHYPELRTKE